MSYKLYTQQTSYNKKRVVRNRPDEHRFLQLLQMLFNISNIFLYLTNTCVLFWKIFSIFLEHIFTISFSKRFWFHSRSSNKNFWKKLFWTIVTLTDLLPPYLFTNNNEVTLVHDFSFHFHNGRLWTSRRFYYF